MREWYALRTKPKKELSSAALLERAGIEVYLPQARLAKGRSKAPQPYFPSYFFGRLDPSLGEIRLASYTMGITSVVGYGGQPWPVPDEVIQAIQQRLAHGDYLADQPDFKHGEHLVITDGPLAGVEAIFDSRLSGTGRARVLIRILERLCRAELRIWQLQRT